METGSRLEVEDTFTAVAVAESVDPGGAFQLIDVNVDFNTAPTTAENITVLATTDGGFAKEILTQDPSNPSTTQVRWAPVSGQRFANGTVISIAYTNTDVRTINTCITYQLDESVV